MEVCLLTRILNNIATIKYSFTSEKEVLKSNFSENNLSQLTTYHPSIFV